MLHILKKTVKEEEIVINFGGDFNPNWDGNLLSWYDGDFGLSSTQWLDKHTGGHDIVFSNNPTVLPNGLNGYPTVLFDGVAQYGRINTPFISQPNSIYLVINQKSWTSSDIIIDDGNNNSLNLILQTGSSPILRANSGASLTLSPNLPINTYGIITVITNGLNSELRLNDNLAVTGNLGTNNRNGITLASQRNGLLNSNVEIAYIIIRTGLDDTTKQDYIINNLKNRFAI